MPDIVQNFSGFLLQKQVSVDKQQKKQAVQYNCLYPFQSHHTVYLPKARCILPDVCPSSLYTISCLLHLAPCYLFLVSYHLSLVTCILFLITVSCYLSLVSS